MSNDNNKNKENRDMFFDNLSRELYESCARDLPYNAKGVIWNGSPIDLKTHSWLTERGSLSLWQSENKCLGTGLFMTQDGLLCAFQFGKIVVVSGHGKILPETPSTFLATRTKLSNVLLLEKPQSPGLPDGYAGLPVPEESPLRPPQREAVRKANAPISFIWGPPGTGKTFTIVEAIKAILNNKKNKILVTSTADKAVDAVVEGLSDMGDIVQQFKDEECTDTPCRKVDFHQQEAKRAVEDIDSLMHSSLASAALKQARVYCTNSLSACAKLMNEKFEGITHLIIDEASMMPMWMVSILNYLLTKKDGASLKIVFVGDPNQLPCVIVWSGLKKTAMAKNIYQHFGIGDVSLSNERNIVTFLDHTSRMPNLLTRAVSSTFYGGALQPIREAGQFDGLFGIEGEHQVGYCNGQPAPWSNLIEFNPTAPNPPKFPKNTSMDEAYEVTKLAWLCQNKGRKCLILTPYVSQVNLINDWLQLNTITSVEATTIHKAQGQEADIVIWSVVANGEKGVTWFNRHSTLTSRPIANVALSRAKHQVFIIGAFPGQQTVAGEFLANWENAGQEVPSAPQPQPQDPQPQQVVQAEPQQVQPQVQEPKLSPDEEYRRELTANAAEEFFAQGSSTSFEFVEQVEEPEGVNSEVSADPAPIDNIPEVTSQPEVSAPTDTSGELDPKFKEWLESTGRIDKYLDGPGYRKDHMKRVYKLTLEKNSK